MERFILIVITMVNFFANVKAQTQAIKMAGTTIELKGNKVSNIKLLNVQNKVIGNQFTFTSISSKEIVFSSYQNYNDEGPTFVYIQKITLSATANLIPEVAVQKAFINAEEVKSPKQTWDVTVSFKQSNGDYVDVGATVLYRLSYEGGKPKAVKENNTGTNRVLPFATKKAADEFAAKVKAAFNKS
jgi:hypothetical protein